MTVESEHLAYLKDLTYPRLDGERDENGVDLSLIRENLARSPAARLERGNRLSKLLLDIVSDKPRIEGVPLDRRWAKVLDDFAEAMGTRDASRVSMLRAVADELLTRTGFSCRRRVRMEQLEKRPKRRRQIYEARIDPALIRALFN